MRVGTLSVAISTLYIIAKEADSMSKTTTIFVSIAALAAVGVGVWISLRQERTSSGAGNTNPPRDAQNSPDAVQTANPANSKPSEKDTKPAITVRPSVDRDKLATLLSSKEPGASGDILNIYATASETDRNLIEKTADPDLRAKLIQTAVSDLSSSDASQQAAGLDSLRRMNDPSGSAKAINLLSSTTEPSVKQSSVEYLGRINSVGAFDSIKDVASKEADPALRATAINALPRCGGRERPAEAVAILTDALKSKDATVQAEALAALARFPGQVSSDTLSIINGLQKSTAKTRDGRTIGDLAKEVSELLSGDQN